MATTDLEKLLGALVQYRKQTLSETTLYRAKRVIADVMGCIWVGVSSSELKRYVQRLNTRSVGSRPIPIIGTDL